MSTPQADTLAEDPAYAIALEQFNAVAERLEMDSGMRDLLRVAKRELIIELRVKMEEGGIEVLTGYRTEEKVARGSGKGGIG